ncbi:multiple epidermal growth factor-like domains protein 10 [Ostrea edulis]|uniref:multiple epidermal growth factor-like domains protein 10 n=1 Tax=Ostrea edulis TaxID=37623 RepID=UPI0024AEB619|nr:multiple epidermal growth factor-like domains protein 10 [Ostrea edulis]
MNMILIFLLSYAVVSKVTSYDNIASGKAAQQLYPFSSSRWGADKAVDGLKSDCSVAGGQCTISGLSKETARWWVDLGGVLSIRHITIYYRTDNLAWDFDNPYTTRFLGFSVYISNTTNKENGVLCFKDTVYTKATIPNPTNITCPNHGRYVIYYIERLQGVTYPPEYSSYAHNELCEFEVYGCPTPGVYGENCDRPCPQNCQKRHCDIVTGTCLGCIPGYKGSFCDQPCDNKKYGMECKQNCGNCSDGMQCNHVNGSCPNGCDVGVRGDKCDEECPKGRYGYNCQERCNINCGVPERCDKGTGQCQNGCQAGWKNHKCDSKCDGKTFGLGCTRSCGVCLGNEQCHHVNGTCQNGCDRGYEGISCIQECPTGRYGENCAIACYPNCRGCNRFNGRCESGCFPGWKGTFCEKECEERMYGENCTRPCGQCRDLEQCHHINGTCLNGCNRGYQGGECTEECLEGWFGYNCEKKCSIQCDSVTGLLIGQCSDSSASSQSSPALYGTVTGLCLSVVLNIYFIIRYLRDKKLQPKNQQKNKKEQLSTEGDAPSATIYNNTEDAGGYQELGELGQQSHYDQLNSHSFSRVFALHPCVSTVSKLNMILILFSCVFVSKVISYDNIALQKPAQQQDPYCASQWGVCFTSDLYYNSKWGADRAVDGRKSNLYGKGGECTLSNNYRRTAKWWVDLGGVFSVHHITIYYRTDNKAWDSSNGYTTRFLGFSVYISNTTSKRDGVLCFKDTEYNRTTIPNPTNITCPRHGQYVIYYNERLPNVTYPPGYSRLAYNELCEVEVYGCPTPDVYGENCSTQCPQNCQERHCDIVNGTCLGCLPGYKGSLCQQLCDNNKYGLGCKQNCGNCSDGEQCNHVNGSCPNGCDAGAQGDECDVECPEGRYGYNCQERCNINCGVSERCDRVTGGCQNGCQAGWKSQKCDSKCDDKTFGQDCTQMCGVCLDNEQCHHVNGTCTNGCDRGYKGINCTQECPEGWFGYNCEKKCNIQCDNVTGLLIGQSPDCGASSQLHPALYGLVAGFCLSVVLNIYLIVRYLRDKKHQPKNRQNMKEQLSTKSDPHSATMCDYTEDAGSYIYEEVV